MRLFPQHSTSHLVLVTNSSDFRWRHHGKMVTNSLVSGVLRFGVGKLEATVSTLTKRNDRRKLNRCSAAP